MHLLAALAAGVKGAEDGTVKVLSMGTDTPARVYSDYDGTVETQPSTGIVLDANGGTTLYVNEWVDVTAYDSTGTAVRAWTEGAAAPDVEVRSLSFTGTNRTTGARNAGEPLSLQTALDLWLTSAGEPDFNVLFNGASSSIQNALGSFAGIFYNVKSPAYGAVGDGATDDSTAIQAALTAAGNAGGGIVFFPSGSYKHTVKLTVPAKVSLWGVGGATTILLLYHATTDQLEYGTGTGVDTYQEIRGLALRSGQSNSGLTISITSAGNRALALFNCYVSGSLNTGHAIAITAPASDKHRLLLDACQVNLFGTAALGVFAVGASIYVEARNCAFVALVDQWGGGFLSGRNIVAIGNTFSAAIVTTGFVAYYCIDVYGVGGAGPKARIVGNLFIAGTAGTGNAMVSSYADEATTAYTEAGNSIQGTFSNGIYGNTLASSANRPKIQLLTRDYLTKSVSDTNSGTLSIDALNYGIISLTRTVAGAQTINANGVGPEGSYLTLLVWWNGGGALGNITLGTNFWPGIATFSPASGKLQSYTFRAGYANSSGAWIPVAPIYQIP